MPLTARAWFCPPLRPTCLPALSSVLPLAAGPSKRMKPTRHPPFRPKRAAACLLSAPPPARSSPARHHQLDVPCTTDGRLLFPDAPPPTRSSPARCSLQIPCPSLPKGLSHCYCWPGGRPPAARRGRVPPPPLACRTHMCERRGEKNGHSRRCIWTSSSGQKNEMGLSGIY